MGEFQRALAADEVPPGHCAEAAVGGKPVAIYNVGGTFYATSNICLHRGGPLGQGMLTGKDVMCPWHAWSWDVTNGENTANGSLKVSSYPVKVEDGQVLVQVD